MKLRLKAVAALCFLLISIQAIASDISKNNQEVPQLSNIANFGKRTMQPKIGAKTERMFNIRLASEVPEYLGLI